MYSRSTSLFRKTIPITCLFIGHSFAINNYAFCNKELSFDTKNFASEIISPHTKENLKLIGVGMRKKNLFITDLHLYLVGVHFNNRTLERIKEWKNNKSQDPFTSIILPSNENTSLLSLNTTESPVSIKLKFVRNLSADQIVKAFNDAFHGVSEEDINLFKEQLLKCIGDEKGVVNGDELDFNWINNDSLFISNNDTAGDIIKSPDISKRLLDIYLDSKNTVCKELLDSVNSNIDNLVNENCKE